MKMENLDIRIKVDADGLLYKDIAEEIGITDVHLSRLMSKKLTLENRERILTAINNLKRTELTEDEKEGQKRFNEWLNKNIKEVHK